MAEQVLATGIILAGGKSSRMGSDKSLLPWGEANLSLTEIVFANLQPICQQILLVSNSKDKFSFIHRENGQEIADIYPNHGPLGGIHAGLSYAKYDYCFISSCDLPNFHGGLAAYLLSQASGYDLVLPCIDGFFQPLFAVIHRRVLPIIEAELLNGENNKVMFVYRKMKMRIIEKEEILPFGDPQELFYNINTPLDYQKKPF